MDDFVKEAMGLSLREPSRAAEDRTLWTSLIHRVPRSWSPFYQSMDQFALLLIIKIKKNCSY